MKYIQLKIKFLVLSTSLILFTGCSQSAFKHFDKKEEFVQNAQYTKVVKVVEENVVKAIANITYLNGADSKTWDNGKQNFIIGLYIIDENKKCCTLDLTISKKKNIQLDKTKIEYEEKTISSLNQKAILKSDSLYENIPFRNNWADYKLVSFDEKAFEDIETLSFKFKDKRVLIENEDGIVTNPYPSISFKKQ